MNELSHENLPLGKYEESRKKEPNLCETNTLKYGYLKSRNASSCEDPDVLQKDLDEFLALSKNGEKIGIRNQILFAFGVSGLAFAAAAFYANINDLDASVVARLQNGDGIKMSERKCYTKATIKANPYVVPGTVGAVFLALYGAWNMPVIRLRGRAIDFKPFLSRYFVHRPLSGRSYTLLTNVFFHRHWFHLGSGALFFSVYVACAYRDAHPQLRLPYKPIERLADPDTNAQLCALFLSAGVFASLAHHIRVSKSQWPRMLSQYRRRIAFLRKPAHQRLMPPRLLSIDVVPMNQTGAIGASMAIAGACFMNLDHEYILPYLPFNVLWTGYAGWTGVRELFYPSGSIALFSHAVGSLIGILYYHHGTAGWMALRRFLQPVSGWVHRMRSNLS